jgi:OFA family oxalate/formate antiporter-like MFS transporter
MAFALIASTDNFAVMLLPFALIALCYGGGFGTMPAFAADLFGPKNSGTIYGTMLTAWSAGAVAGPILISALPYRLALFCIALLLALASVIPIVVNALTVRRSQLSLRSWSRAPGDGNPPRQASRGSNRRVPVRS